MASIRRLLVCLILILLPLCLQAEPQDPPDIPGYEVPVDARPSPRAYYMDFVDMGVLFLALSLTSYLVLVRRSRKGIFLLALFSLGYFGFFREGCVCPIGSIQNVAESLFNPAAVASLVVLFFFFLPLLYSALFGRSYCASVCPHGAIQDAVLFKPIVMPKWLDSILGLFPFIYLGLGVLYAATGTAFIICDYDPFIAIFRLEGYSSMLGMGALFLLAGMFIGRPYCRYMCPYGVLLRLFSYVSKWRLKIYPDSCIDCHLCDASCPFDAINQTTANEIVSINKGKKNMKWALMAAPVLIIGFGYLCSLFSGVLSQPNRYVQLAYSVEAAEIEEMAPKKKAVEKKSKTKKEKSKPVDEKMAYIKEKIESLKDKPLNIGPLSKAQLDIKGNNWQERKTNLFAKAAEIQSTFYIGAWVVGIFIGLVIAVKLIKINIRRTRKEYEADRGNCYSCGRCYEFCPGSNGIPVQDDTGGHVRA